MDVEKGETTPLLASSTGSQGRLKDLPAESIKEKAVAGVAAIGFASSLVSLLVESVTTHPAVLVSGILGIVLAPYAALQQRKITESEALRQTNAQMESEAIHLEAENDRLREQVNKVEGSVQKLQGLEDTLSAINSLEGDSVKQLEQQLEESRDILKHMKHNYKAIILQNLVTLLIASDNNQDMLLSDGEIDELIFNLEEINGVELKEDLLRQKIIDEGRSIGAIMEVARNALASSKGTQQTDLFTYLEQ